MTSRSDTAKRPADVPWKPVGAGLAPQFRCGACDKPSSPAGRKLKHVLGLRTYVCARCAA